MSLWGTFWMHCLDLFFFLFSLICRPKAGKFSAGWPPVVKKSSLLTNTLSLPSSCPYMFCQRVRVCQWRVCVSQPEVWWTWQLSGRLRWGQCSLTLLMQMIDVLSSGLCRFKMCPFRWPGARRLKRRTFSATLKWHFKDMSCSSLADWLCEGVQGGWVPLSEPRSLHPSALALRWRVWLHGPQWRGKLQPRCGWWFTMQRNTERFTIQRISEHLFQTQRCSSLYRV